MKMTLDEKIYKLGFKLLDELLLHRNTSKSVDITLEDGRALAEFIIHVGPHTIITFSEAEIVAFYKCWAQRSQEFMIYR